MRYPVSEALDRYSILWLKRFFGCDVDAEFEAFENYLRDQLHEDWQLVRNSLQLGTCNALQWMLEECVSPFEDDECVAQAAIEIRRSNMQRVAAKNALAEQLGGGFQDQRVRYPGAEILAHDDAKRPQRVRTTYRIVEEADAELDLSPPFRPSRHDPDAVSIVVGEQALHEKTWRDLPKHSAGDLGSEILGPDDLETQLRHRLTSAVQGYVHGMEAHYYMHGDGATGGFDGLSHLIEEAEEAGDEETRIHKLEADLQAIIDRNADACDYRATGDYDLAAFDAERAQREGETKRLIAEAETLGKWELVAIAPRLHVAWVSAHGPSQAERVEAEANPLFRGLNSPDALAQWRDLPKHEVDDPNA